MTTGPAAELKDTRFADALGERYLSYAMSTIIARSLPDVRDGLKPVHRRLLYAMRELGLDPRSGYKKAARVVGDVIGKFHPHGEQAVYDALVRLAQDFAVRYPLVDGQGNFGNIDGDNPAAMRYTEARLTAVAEALLDGIDEDAVDLRATYDGELSEPVVLPAAFPNLLANGANGIAVGMATSIPPHNAAELCDAALHLIRNPEAPVTDLLAYVKGPDFPTGGVLVEPPEAVRAAYETGRGGFRLRARWAVEKGKNGLYTVVVTEIPYQVQKGRLIERIAELLAERKLMLLADIRDESAEDVRIVLEPKSRTVDPDMLMESLFRQSDLEVRVPLNLNVVDTDGVPRVIGLGDALRGWLGHREQVLIRRARHRLDVIDRRLDVLHGHLIAYLNLDEVIRIIREEDEPKPVLMTRFALNETQAEAILNMRLRHLRRLEEMEIRREFDALTAERAGLEALLGDGTLRWQRIAEQIAATRDAFGPATALGKRRTEIGGTLPVVEMPAAALVEREPITVLLSRMGWVRAVRGHDLDPAEVKYKEGDGPGFLVKAETTDRVLVAATDGRFYTLAADKLPRGRGFGEPLRLTLDLGQDQDVVALMVAPAAGAKLLLAAGDARGFLVDAGELAAQTRAGRQVMTPADGARLVACLPVAGEDHVAVIGTNRKLLIFPLAEVPELARGRGVILQKYQDAKMSDIRLLRLADGLEVPHGTGRRQIADLAPWLGRRATAGRLPPHGFPRTNRFPE